MASTRKTRQEGAAQALAGEEEAFRRQRTKLLRRYEGQFVALYQGHLVAHGPDDEELARKLFADLGDRPFYIAKVERQPTVYELPAPELER